MELIHQHSPSPLNPLGVKGVGEGSAISPPVVIANAVSDALAAFKMEFNSTPIRPEQIAKAVAAGDRNSGGTESHDVDGDRRRDAAACAPVLHHAGTEDKAMVAQVREVAADIGERLRALKPDLWIIFSNDHAEQFFHTAAPPFTVHVGGEATGDFAGRKFHWKVPSEIGFELVRQLYRQNFDPAFTSTAKIDYAIGIPLTHLGHTDPVLPIYVNAYLPPQPTMERCYAVRPGGGAHRHRDGAARP